MEINKVHLIYFSPTGTTKKIIEAIAGGLGSDQLDHCDLTYPRKKTKKIIENEIAIIGTPVYAGRIPEDCLQRLESYKAKNVPTILIVLYGNREFEDALVELRDVANKQGFKVVAAGAFIGEHSYATQKHPIAAGRPNEEDLSLACKFGQEIASKLAQEVLTLPDIDGDVPYRERIKFGGIAPETDLESCILCGQCAQVCPVQIISVTNKVTTKAESCIMCCACIKICPTQARYFNHPFIKEKRELLTKHCMVPKPPKLFL